MKAYALVIGYGTDGSLGSGRGESSELNGNLGGCGTVEQVERLLSPSRAGRRHLNVPGT